MITIDDAIHCERLFECERFDEAVAELRYLASVPWDHAPNRAPCKGWRKCGREYELRDVDDTETPWKTLRRVTVLKLSRHGVRWSGDFEEEWRDAGTRS
jgi:hypothetical protein